MITDAFFLNMSVGLENALARSGVCTACCGWDAALRYCNTLSPRCLRYILLNTDPYQSSDDLKVAIRLRNVGCMHAGTLACQAGGAKTATCCMCCSFFTPVAAWFPPAFAVTNIKTISRKLPHAYNIQSLPVAHCKRRKYGDNIGAESRVHCTVRTQYFRDPLCIKLSTEVALMHLVDRPCSTMSDAHLHDVHQHAA